MVDEPVAGRKAGRQGWVGLTLAMALAVLMLSPVTMRTMTPAICALLTASFTSLRRGSMMPTMPSHTRSALSGGFSSQPSGSLEREGKSR